MTEPTPTYTVTRQRAPGAGRKPKYASGTERVHVHVWLSASEVDALDAMRGTGESRADVVRRMIAQEAQL